MELKKPIVRSNYRLRWVTWWPVRYWTERFNALADRSDCDIDVVFLAGRSTLLDCSVNEARWRFNHKYLTRGSDDTGYYNPKWRFGNPAPLVFPRVDALVMTYGDPICIGAALLCRLLRWPYVLFAPNTKTDARQYRSYKEWLKGFLFQGAYRIFVTGPRQREYAFQYVKSGEKIVEIGNPAPPVSDHSMEQLARRDVLRRQFGWHGSIVVLYVGRLAEEKGLTTLLGATRILHENGIRIKLVLVGTGRMGGLLTTMGNKWGLDLEMPGFLEGEELARIYAAADIFVLPSVSEPWGLVVNEAMEFGLPLILSRNVGSTPVLLKENVNGYSFEAEDQNELASKLEKLCESSTRRKKMGFESKRIVEEHSLSSWTDGVIASLRKKD